MSRNPSKFKAWYWGNPYAQPIKSSEYQAERDDVTRVIDRFIDKDLFIKKIGLIDTLLKHAAKHKPKPNRRVYATSIISRLWDAGVRGRDILIEISALVLYHIRRPDRILDQNHLIYLMGNKVIRIVPYWYRTTGKQHKRIGKYLWDELKYLLVFICKAVLRFEQVDKLRKSRFCEPLEI